MNNLFSENGNESLYIHLNISLPYHLEESHSLISNLKADPKIIKTSENRPKKGNQPNSSIDLRNYTFEHTKGGNDLYVPNGIRYKLQKNLLISKLKQLDSTSAELVNNCFKNIITGCIHKHPTLNNQQFLGGYILPFFDKLSLENKEVIVLEGFNIYQINYKTD